VKGIVFNLLEEVVRESHGEDTWDDLLEAAGLDGAYSALGSYPDGDLLRLVAAASAALKLPPDEVVRWFAQQALPLLARKYPGFFQAHRSTRPFLLTLNDIIHPEVRKIYPGADVPEFGYDTSMDKVLVMSYRSPRHFCAFAQGLVEGAAAHYGEGVTFEHLRCMKAGDPECLWRIEFRPGEAAHA